MHPVPPSPMPGRGCNRYRGSTVLVSFLNKNKTKHILPGKCHMLLKSPRVEICERWSWLVAHHSVCVRVCVCVCITDRKRTEYSGWQRNPGTSITQSEPSAVVWSAQKKRKEKIETLTQEPATPPERQFTVTLQRGLRWCSSQCKTTGNRKSSVHIPTN